MVQRVAGYDEIDAAGGQDQFLDWQIQCVQAGHAPPPGLSLELPDHGRADVHRQDPGALLGQRQAELPGPATQVDDLILRSGVRGGEHGCGHGSQSG